MKKILIAALSINGKIAQEGSQSSLEWTSKEDTQYFKTRTKSAKNLIMGRKTFQTINKPLKGRIIYIMTRDKDLLGKKLEGLVFTDSTPEGLVKTLEKKGEKECAIVGGQSVYRQFLDLGLVDELHLTIEPIIFKGGINLAEGLKRDIEWNLKGVEKLNESTILLKYVYGSFRLQ